ncbi:GIP, partial [Symbiodinium necroappetens]
MTIPRPESVMAMTVFLGMTLAVVHFVTIVHRARSGSNGVTAGKPVTGVTHGVATAGTGIALGGLRILVRGLSVIGLGTMEGFGVQLQREQDLLMEVPNGTPRTRQLINGVATSLLATRRDKTGAYQMGGVPPQMVKEEALVPDARKEAEALTLYQNLSDRVDYLIEWIKDRYLDVQVTQIGRSLSGFFRGIDEGDEVDEEGIFDLDEQEDCVSEEVALDLYQAFMTHESAKQRYRENAKLRGSDPESLKQLAMDKLKAAKAKSFCAGCKRRGHWHKDAICPLNRGSSEAQGTVSSSATTGSTARTSGNTKEFAKAQYPCHVVHVTWEIEGYQNKDLLAITDTACSRSVAGAAWVDTYVTEARRLECDPQFTSCREAFKFGASKVFVASYGILLCFEMGGYKVGLKVAVVNGDVPLLVSRGALGKMGMLLDVAENRATFKALGVKDLLLETTETGHPAFQIKPSPLPKAFVQGPEWDSSEIKIVPQAEPYMSARASRGLCDDGDDGVDASTSSGSRSCLTSWMVYVQDEVMKNDGTPFPRTPRGKPALDYVPLFYSKRVGIATRNLLLDVNFNPETFAAWWSSTNISNDFWIEDEDFLVRVHVIPRRSFLPYMVCGVSLEMSLLSLFFGSEGVSFVDDDQCLTLPHFAFLAQMASSSDLLTAPIVTRPKTLSEFTKAELLAEARARNLWINEKWTAVELRSAIQEDRRNPS